MNIERVTRPAHPEKITQQELASSLHELTVRLAGGKGLNRRRRSVALERNITEAEDIGRDVLEARLANQDLSTTIRFEAIQSRYETDRGEPSDQLLYVVDVRVERGIAGDELPLELLAGLHEESLLEDSYMDDELVELMEVIGGDFSPQNMSDFECTQLDSTRYEIDEDGEIIEITHSSEYSIDEVIISENSYVRSLEGVKRNVTYEGLPELRDWYAQDVPQLDEATLTEESVFAEDAAQLIILESKLSALGIEHTFQSQQEQRARVLGSLALLQTGLFKD